MGGSTEYGKSTKCTQELGTQLHNYVPDGHHNRLGGVSGALAYQLPFRHHAEVAFLALADIAYRLPHLASLEEE